MQQATPQLVAAFRELRETWFKEKLLKLAHERCWESESEERRREAENASTKAIFDQQTEQIIQGCPDIPVCPRCYNDLSRAGKK